MNNTPINTFDESELELLLDGQDLLEEKPLGVTANMEANYSSLVMGHNEDEIKAQVEEKVKQARIELKNRKYRIILLKAKLVQSIMNQSATNLFGDTRPALQRRAEGGPQNV